MNGTEQRERHTAVTRVERQLTDVQALTEELDKKVADVAKTALAAIDDECTHRLQLANEQRAYVDGEDAVLRQELKMLREHYLDFQRGQRTFWGRLRWLFTGHP